MATLSNLLLLGGAGALGTLARYATSELANRLAGGSYPLGTLNWTGDDPCIFPIGLSKSLIPQGVNR